MRREMIRGGRGGWLYSGMEEIGWSWVDVVGVGFGEDILEGVEGEVMVLGIPFLMEYIRGLVGGIGKFSSYRSECGGIVLRLEGEGEVFESRGKDREEVFLGMLGQVGEWYWEDCRPSFSNINFRDVMMGSDVGVSGEMKFDVEIREVGGEVEVIFEDFWAAKMFMGRWNRFILEEGGGSVYGEDYYHGRMLMLEGEVRVMSVGSGSGGVMPPGMWGGYSSGVNYNVSGGGGNWGMKVAGVYGGGSVGIPAGGVGVEVGFGEMEDMVGVGRPS